MCVNCTCAEIESKYNTKVLECDILKADNARYREALIKISLGCINTMLRNSTSSNEVAKYKSEEKYVDMMGDFISNVEDIATQALVEQGILSSDLVKETIEGCL